MGSIDDTELMLRIKRRDEIALGAMMQKYSPQVFSAAFRVLRQRPEAQEVTQDVFLALWRSPEKFDARRGSLLTWLMIVSRSRALDVLRRVLAHSRRQHGITLETLHTNSDLVQSSDRKILIEELLRRLPGKQECVLQKAYLEGYALSEIATLEGTPLGTIKNRARFALKKLRSELS
jgi:RNA polymerase sigma-70 factor (ECF subfamily)